ncbi:BCCT family transporter [Bacillus sp. ISL-39]|nr:BCCT family transporter [Bacillus sp. ISL-39]
MGLFLEIRIRRDIISQKKQPGITLYISAAFVLGFVLWGVIAPENLNASANKALNWTISYFSWFYMAATTFFVFFMLYLAFSPYRNIKLGKDEDEPKYSYFTWLGLLFAGGMGVGLVFWGVAEPLQHYADPAPGVEAETTEAAESALKYSVFHWGLQPWAGYGLVGLTIAYFKFRRNKASLISHAFYPLLGEKVNGFLGKSINIVSIIATAIGVATTFGLSAMQVSGGLGKVFGFPNSSMTQLIVIAVVTVLFMISALSGVNKGIRILSNINLGIASLLFLFVLFAGPTIFLLESAITSFGSYIGNYFQLSLGLSPFKDSSWRGDWTIFYWAWGISWAPFVGTFIARVSRGRTIREFVLGVLFVPALMGGLWFIVFGGTALHMQIYEGLELVKPAKENVETALFIMLENLPFGKVLSITGLLLITIFFITSADSATYVLSILSSRGTLNPKKYVKLIWGFIISGTASVLLISGGLKSLQAASITTALPFALLIVLMCISVIKGLREDKSN